MHELDRRFGSWMALARWRVLALGLAAVLTLLPWPVNQARGAGTTARLDWGARAPMPTARRELALAAAPNGKLYAVGGVNLDPVESGGCAGFCNIVEEYDPATNTWATRAPMRTRRTGLGLAAAPNGRLYAAGGNNGSIPIGTLEELDPATNTWTSRAGMHGPRSSLSMTTGPNGRLYAVGGDNGSTDVGTLEEYDPATDTWTVKAPMRVPRRELLIAPAPNGKLYATGGFGGACAPTLVCGTTEEYDPATDTWRDVAPLQVGRTHAALATAPNGKLYITGGEAQGGTLLNVTEEYDPAANAWTLRARMPTARSSLALATAPNGRLYAVGGTGDDNTICPPSVYCNQTEEYDPQADSWTVVTVPPLPAGRAAPATAVAGGKLYVFGGQLASTTIPDVLQYDPSTNRWTGMTSMPTPRYGATAMTAPNGKIYVVGGIGASGPCPNLYCTTVEEFTPPSGSGGGTWRTASDGILQLPSPRGFAGLALGPNGRLYVAAGSRLSGALLETYEYDPANTSAWQPMVDLHQGRSGIGLAPAGDGKLYAVGGLLSGMGMTTVERFVLPTAGAPKGSWEGPSGIAGLPAARGLLGLVGLPNGHLIAAGGTDTGNGTTAFADVYEYDPAANGWTTLTPLPTARFELGLALLGSHQLLAVGGRAGGADLPTVELGTHDDLPTVSAGGPYTVTAGSTVQLSATGSDSEGDRLSFAWDLDGSLRYATAGQSVTFSADGLSPGTRTVRVRALDVLDGPNALGGYALANTTVTIVPAPSLCSPRPNVAVATSRAGAGRLQATLTAQTLPATPTNSLQRIVVTRIDNATATLNGSPVTVGASVPFQAGTTQVTLLVQRQSPAAATVAFTVTDACGDWKSFVGGGPGAF